MSKVEVACAQSKSLKVQVYERFDNGQKRVPIRFCSSHISAILYAEKTQFHQVVVSAMIT